MTTFELNGKTYELEITKDENGNNSTFTVSHNDEKILGQFCFWMNEENILNRAKELILSGFHDLPSNAHARATLNS